MHTHTHTHSSHLSSLLFLSVSSWENAELCVFLSYNGSSSHAHSPPGKHRWQHPNTAHQLHLHWSPPADRPPQQRWSALINTWWCNFHIITFKCMVNVGLSISSSERNSNLCEYMNIFDSFIFRVSPLGQTSLPMYVTWFPHYTEWSDTATRDWCFFLGEAQIALF